MSFLFIRRSPYAVVTKAEGLKGLQPPEHLSFVTSGELANGGLRGSLAPEKFFLEGLRPPPSPEKVRYQ